MATTTTYHATGSVCGPCGHHHRTPEAAQRCAMRHGRAVRSAYPSTYPTCAYSDRMVERTDGEPLSDAELDRIARMLERGEQ